MATVIDVVRETDTTVSVVFATAQPLPYRPGQYLQAVFRLGRGRYRRSYSLSSVPADDHASITVKHVPGGKVSQYITSQLAIGDRFLVSASRGDFVLPDSRAGRRFVFVAGGSGIAPVMSLIRTLLAMPAPVPVHLLYYTRNGDDIIFRARLEELADLHPQFDLRMSVTGPRAGWTGAHQPFAIEQVLDAAQDDPQALFYLCGPESLIDAASEGLAAAGIAPARVFLERFASAPGKERPAQGQQATFISRGLLFQRRTRLRTRPGESLLDAAERAGLKVSSNCRNGTCGRCRAKLLDGEVAMDEPNSLTLADAQAGRVLTCVSYATAPVVVDLRH
jgi:ring-1,2-phenylacetyl-CoA epoxidase subunit PaaE